MNRSHTFEHPVIDVIRKRRSIRAFSPALIEPEKISSLFEATRWAPSSTNEQPWAYIYGINGQEGLWDKLFAPLNEGNKVWAKDAPLLVLSLARKHFTRYPGVNTHALYDLGGANAFLALQAVELGMQVRQIAGFDPVLARQNMRVPDDYEIGVYLAVGYPGDPAALPESLQRRETAPRERYRQEVFVMNKPFD